MKKAVKIIEWVVAILVAIILIFTVVKKCTADKPYIIAALGE